jgi:hypothetical protein
MMGGNFCTVPKPIENLLTSPRVLRSASWIVWFTTKIYRRINKVANASSVQQFWSLRSVIVLKNKILKYRPKKVTHYLVTYCRNSPYHGSTVYNAPSSIYRMWGDL